MSNQNVYAGRKICGILIKKNKFKPFYEVLFITQSTVLCGRHCDGPSFCLQTSKGAEDSQKKKEPNTVVLHPISLTWITVANNTSGLMIFAK